MNFNKYIRGMCILFVDVVRWYDGLWLGKGVIFVVGRKFSLCIFIVAKLEVFFLLYLFYGKIDLYISW